MTDQSQPAQEIETEQLADLHAAIQVGADDITAGRHEDVDDVNSWMRDIAATISTKSVA